MRASSDRPFAPQNEIMMNQNAPPGAPQVVELGEWVAWEFQSEDEETPSSSEDSEEVVPNPPPAPAAGKEEGAAAAAAGGVEEGGKKGSEGESGDSSTKVI